MEKEERPEEAVRREVKEEVGIEVEDLKFLGKFLSTIEFKKDNVFCFSAKTNSRELIVDPIEILEAKWVPVAELPALGPIAQKIFNLWSK